MGKKFKIIIYNLYAIILEDSNKLYKNDPLKMLL